FAVAVGESGQVIGRADVADGSSRSVFFTDGAIIPLPGLQDAPSAARGINDLGQVTGSGLQTSTGETHAYFWESGTVTDLGTLGGTFTGTATNGIQRINNCGQIVGRSTTTDEVMHAFLWANGQMTDLNNLIPPNSGWVLLEAT